MDSFNPEKKKKIVPFLLLFFLRKEGARINDSWFLLHDVGHHHQ
jgi:hypothetical protein